MLIISAGMPKSGSGWYFNLINDLLVEYGFDDVRLIREKFGLDDMLRFYNCNIGNLDKENVDRLIPIISQGHTFVVKTHSRPGDYLREIMKSFPLMTTYLCRDPRAVALSAYDHGEKLRQQGKEGDFSGITTFGASISFAQNVYKIWKEWVEFPGVFLAKYEALLANPKEILLNFLLRMNQQPDEMKIKKVLENNQPGKKEGMHFNVGEARRFERVWSQEQLDYANVILEGIIKEMGYE